MDESDIERAEWLTELMRSDGIWRVHQSVKPEQDKNFHSPWCIDCGNEIPPERLALGRIRCIECQKVKEFKEKMQGC